jgi:hypothetical protein
MIKTVLALLVFSQFGHTAQIKDGEALKTIMIKLDGPKEAAQFRLTQEITRSDCNPRGLIGDFKIANAEGELSTTLIVADFVTRATDQDCPLAAPVTETITSDWYALKVTDRLAFRVIVPEGYQVELKSDPAPAPTTEPVTNSN